MTQAIKTVVLNFSNPETQWEEIWGDFACENFATAAAAVEPCAMVWSLLARGTFFPEQKGDADSLQFEEEWVFPKLANHCLCVWLYFGLLGWLQNSLDGKDDKSCISTILLYS